MQELHTPIDPHALATKFLNSTEKVILDELRAAGERFLPSAPEVVEDMCGDKEEDQHALLESREAVIASLHRGNAPMHPDFPCGPLMFQSEFNEFGRIVETPGQWWNRINDGDYGVGSHTNKRVDPGVYDLSTSRTRKSPLKISEAKKTLIGAIDKGEACYYVLDNGCVRIDFMDEKWGVVTTEIYYPISQDFKRSIECNKPKGGSRGISQRNLEKDMYLGKSIRLSNRETNRRNIGKDYVDCEKAKRKDLSIK